MSHAFGTSDEGIVMLGGGHVGLPRSSFRTGPGSGYCGGYRSPDYLNRVGPPAQPCACAVLGEPRRSPASLR
jgi:hypothetical protein